MPSHIGRYRVVRKLGRDEPSGESLLTGPGIPYATYLGRDDDQDRDVVIKTVTGPGARDDVVLFRFHRDARLTAGLQHPNVVVILDVGAEDGVPFMALELMAGRTLEDAIADRISVKAASPIMLQVLDGLAYVHDHGVIHRDLKPANIFIQEDGVAKILDFGLAHYESSTWAADGNIVGTPEYMSPEQVRGDPVDGRSDLFSVGCMLFELVTDRRPFRADNLMAIFYKITHEGPNWELFPKGSEWESLREVIRRALQKNPENRYRNAQAMSRDLKLALEGFPDAMRRGPASLPPKIGRYRVVRELGRGALGAVYLGHDDNLDRDVAVKVLLGSAAHDEGIRRRFLREAEFLARLNHPNIVSLIEVGEHESGPFVVLELLVGRDLAQATKSGIRLGDALVVMQQVLDGLGHGHEQGVVHGDVKPGNIFVGESGQAKILDFGVLASFFDTLPDDSIVGTADYMSPEQVRGEKLDGRSDLWAVGCILFEVVSRRHPFRSDTLLKIFYRITHDDPDWESIPKGSEWDRLRTVITRALQKNPQDRYPDAQAMSRDLRVALQDLGQDAERKIGPPKIERVVPSLPREAVQRFAQEARPVGRVSPGHPRLMHVNLLAPREAGKRSPWLLFVLALLGAVFLAVAIRFLR